MGCYGMLVTAAWSYFVHALIPCSPFFLCSLLFVSCFILAVLVRKCWTTQIECPIFYRNTGQNLVFSSDKILQFLQKFRLWKINYNIIVDSWWKWIWKIILQVWSAVPTTGSAARPVSSSPCTALPCSPTKARLLAPGSTWPCQWSCRTWEEDTTWS